MKNKEWLKEIEIRLNSNIMFLEDYLYNEKDIIINKDKEGIKEGQPEHLSEIIEDLEDIRGELDTVINL